MILFSIHFGVLLVLYRGPPFQWQERVISVIVLISIVILDKVLSLYSMCLVAVLYELIARIFFILSKVILLDQEKPIVNVVTL